MFQGYVGILLGTQNAHIAHERSAISCVVNSLRFSRTMMDYGHHPISSCFRLRYFNDQP